MTAVDIDVAGGGGRGWRRRWMRAGVCAAIFAAHIASVLLVPYTGFNDAALHFINLRESVQDPARALHPWARPLFVLLMVGPGLGGMVAARCFAAGLATLLAWQTMRLADDLRLRRATLAGLLLAWQPVYFTVASDTMSEMPMALAIVAAVRLWWAGRRAASCMVVGFLPMVRPEGFLLAPLWGAMALFAPPAGPKRRRALALATLAVGMLCWTAACWLWTGDPLHFVHRWSWPAQSYESYGRGALLHHVYLWPYYCGPVLIVLFVVGLAPSFRRAMALPWTVWLIVFAAHTILWWRGWFAALGLMRIQACTAPVTALVCLYGWNAIAAGLKRLGVRRRVQWALAAGAAAAASVAVAGYYRYDVRRYRFRPIRECVDFARTHGLLDSAPRVFAADDIAWAEMNVLPDSARGMTNLWDRAEQLGRLRRLPPGSVGIWDDQFGVAWYRVHIEDILPLGYEVLHDTRQRVPTLPFGISRRIPGHADSIRCVVLRKRKR